MSLTEAQIQRYSRQILLREVGGRGQSRLLSRPVRVDGRNAATDAATPYLVAGGAHVLGPAPDDGFLTGASLADFNPDAGVPGAPFACLVAAGAVPSLAVAVVVGGDGVVASGGGCADCLKAAADSLAVAVAPEDALVLGGLAALALQRLCLEVEPVAGLRRWRLGAGGIVEAPVGGCAAHRPPA